MWIFLLFLVTCCDLKGTYGICDQRDLRVCYPSHIQDISFPENEEDFNKVCHALISYTNCLKSYAEECGIENSMIDVVAEDRLDRFNSVLQDACNEGSELHHDISMNLGCLKDAFTNHTNSCAWTDVIMETFKKYLTLERDGTSHQNNYEKEKIDWRKFFCLHRILEGACLASNTFEKCGATTKHLLLNIFKRIGHFEVPCSEENRQGLLEILEDSEIKMETKLTIREIFSDFPN